MVLRVLYSVDSLTDFHTLTAAAMQQEQREVDTVSGGGMEPVTF